MDDLFRDIPLDRNDEKCLNCGGGRLQGVRVGRETDEDHYQSLWNCQDCGNLVVVIDEERNQDCPTCNSEGVLTKSRRIEIEKEKKEREEELERFRSADFWNIRKERKALLEELIYIFSETVNKDWHDFEIVDFLKEYE